MPPKRRLLDDAEFHEMVIRIDERTGNTAEKVNKIEDNQTKIWGVVGENRDDIGTNRRKISNLKNWFSGAVAVSGVIGLVVTIYKLVVK